MMKVISMWIKQIFRFKGLDNMTPYPFCFVSVSKDFAVHEMKKFHYGAKYMIVWSSWTLLEKIYLISMNI